MNQTLYFPHCLPWRRIVGWVGVCALIGWWGTSGLVSGAETTNAAPVTSSTSSAVEEGFGQYLVEHQKDLGPFFAKYGEELIKQATFLLLGLLGRVVFLTLIAGWAIDVFLGRCFSAFFAPIYAKLKRAFIYATGQLVVNVVIAILWGLTIILCASLPYFGVIILLLSGIMLCVNLAIQTGWVAYLYRTKLSISAGFYLGVFIIHLITAILVAAPTFGSKASDLATGFVDQSVTPKLQAETGVLKHDLAAVGTARDEIKAKVTQVQDRLTQAQSKQQEFEKGIEEKKNSEVYLYGQIMKVEARGDLTAAHKQLTDFLARFPTGIRTDAAKAQLAQVDSDMAAQTAQKKQAEDDATRAAAQARADLLKRAAKGEVTLSEMRLALIGKTPAEVSAMFGPAVETGSNRWGYGQKMILNPLTSEKFGLTVYFDAGVVQGVDYYYGGPK